MEPLFQRDIVDEVVKYLPTRDVVVLHGARQVGKTSILYLLKNFLEKKGEVVYFIDLEDSRLVRILDSGVETFVKHLEEEGVISSAGDKRVYIFIDEIQYLAEPSSFMKLVADHYKNIKLIVSGSSSFAVKSKFRDSLAGRTVNFEVFNLSFREFLRFQQVPFEEGRVYTEKKADELREKFRDYLLYGGYPKIVLTPEVEKKEKYLQQIVDTYVKKDIRDLAGIKDIDKFNKLLETLASQSGQLLNVAEISSTTRMAKQTVEKYLFIMENTYLLKRVRPFSGNLRSELFRLPKVYFYDTGLMQVLWLKKLQKEVLGQVFETGIFAELVKKYGPDSVFYWRTKDKREIDFILKKGETLLPIEAKLNFGQFNPSAVHYFQRRYNLSRYLLVGLNGRKMGENAVHPWDL